MNFALLACILAATNALNLNLSEIKYVEPHYQVNKQWAFHCQKIVAKYRNDLTSAIKLESNTVYRHSDGAEHKRMAPIVLKLLEMSTYYKYLKVVLVQRTVTLLTSPLSVPITVRNMRRLKKGLLLARAFMQ